jgi:hypothetical protein
MALSETGIVEERMHRDFQIVLRFVVDLHHTVKEWASGALTLHSHSDVWRKDGQKAFSKTINAVSF